MGLFHPLLYAGLNRRTICPPFLHCLYEITGIKWSKDSEPVYVTSVKRKREVDSKHDLEKTVCKAHSNLERRHNSISPCFYPAVTCGLDKKNGYPSECR